MKDKIYTIPVVDAFKEDCECPFCLMKKSLEDASIEFVLGPSYMEVDVREQTNKLGFCKEHVNKLYSNKNRLGLALMLHSHLNEVKSQVENIISTDEIKSKKKLFSNKQADDKKIYTYISEKKSSCYICDKINMTFERYIDTFFYLIKKDKSFVDLVQSCSGFCLEHFALIYNEAPKKLNGSSLESFYNIISPIQIDNINRILEELDWFIKKSDYRFANEPWNNSKDALRRTIQKVNGLIINN
jgi:hypothetical protein